MKRILVGSAVAVALLSASSAFAADLAARPYTKAPVMVDPGYNWSGFYVGVNGGYSWGRSNATVIPTTLRGMDILRRMRSIGSTSDDRMIQTPRVAATGLRTLP